MKKVSVIIVNHNTREILADCLENLLKSDYPELEIIVVDNGSTDDSVKMVRMRFPEVNLIEGHNVGLAAGGNKGLREATGDYLLYLGSDAFPDKNTISGMIEYMESNADVGIATCKLVLRNGQLDLDAHRGFPTPWTAVTHFLGLGKVFPKSKLFNRYFMGWEDLDEPHEIDLCISHFMLVRREVFDRIGLWDEDYFVYGEDVDFCYRTKEAGYKIMYLPQFKAIHYKGASVGTRKESADISKATRDTKIRMSKETTKAMKLFYEKHYADKYPWFVTGAVIFGINTLAKIRSKRV